MPSIVWASLFLISTIAGSLIGSVAMLGMPIAVEIKSGMIALFVIVAVSGMLLPSISASTTPHDKPHLSPGTRS